MDERTFRHVDIGGSKQIHVTKIGDKLILEPLESSLSDVLAWGAHLDALGALDFLPDGLAEDAPFPPDETLTLD